MEKILNQCNQIFSCRINSHQGLRISCISKEERIGANWHDSSWKKYWKRFIKIKSWKPLKARLWACIINWIHSLYKCRPNPRAKNLRAAPENKSKVWVFVKKFQNWNHDSKAFQDQIIIPLPSWDFKEGFQIKTIHSNTKKR